MKLTAALAAAILAFCASTNAAPLEAADTARPTGLPAHHPTRIGPVLPNGGHGLNKTAQRERLPINAPRIIEFCPANLSERDMTITQQEYCKSCHNANIHITGWRAERCKLLRGRLEDSMMHGDEDLGLEPLEQSGIMKSKSGGPHYYHDAGFFHGICNVDMDNMSPEREKFCEHCNADGNGGIIDGQWAGWCNEQYNNIPDVPKSSSMANQVQRRDHLPGDLPILLPPGTVIDNTCTADLHTMSEERKQYCEACAGYKEEIILSGQRGMRCQKLYHQIPESDLPVVELLPHDFTKLDSRNEKVQRRDYLASNDDEPSLDGPATTTDTDVPFWTFDDEDDGGNDNDTCAADHDTMSGARKEFCKHCADHKGGLRCEKLAEQIDAEDEYGISLPPFDELPKLNSVVGGIKTDKCEHLCSRTAEYPTTAWDGWCRTRCDGLRYVDGEDGEEDSYIEPIESED